METMKNISFNKERNVSQRKDVVGKGLSFKLSGVSSGFSSDHFFCPVYQKQHFSFSSERPGEVLMLFHRSYNQEY